MDGERAGDAGSDGGRDADGAGGARALRLIAQRWVIAVLVELEERPLRPHELERRLPGLSHAGLMRRLAELSREGVVRHDRSRDMPPRAFYAITPHGRALLAIAERAARWEQRTRVRTRTVPGAFALRVVADGRSLELMLALSAGASGPRALGRRCSIGHAALMRRLARLTDDGLLSRDQVDGRVRYALREETRGLAELAIAAMRHESRFSSARRVSSTALLEMLGLLAPAAALPPELAGLCVLRVPGAGGDRELWLDAAGGSLRVRPPAAGRPPDAHARAPGPVWLDVLCEGHSAALVPHGDASLLRAVIDALSVRHGGAKRGPRAPIS